MTHDMRTTNEMMSDNQQPLELSAELRGEASGLFAPMDRSLARSITAVIGMRRSRSRALQGLWFGFVPVMAVAIVVMLYVGGAVFPRMQSFGASKKTLFAPNPEIRAQGVAPNGFDSSESVAALDSECQPLSFHIVLEGNVARRKLLATWLRARHADVALELDNAVSGRKVPLKLNPDEVRGFVALMALHGFTGQESSGIRTVARYSPASWASSLGISSLFICLIP